MSIIIKKISRSAVISIASVFGIALFLLGKFFFGMLGLNTQKMESEVKKVMKDGVFINSAFADIPGGGSQCSGNCCENGAGTGS